MLKTWGNGLGRTALLCALSISITAPVWAQETKPTAEATTIDADAQTEADETAYVDTAPEEKTSSRSSLDEVVVTAQRREENIKDVPLSVTAIGEQQMQEMDMVDLNDLNRMAPSVKVSASGVFNAIYIRGLGSGVNWGVDQAVGIFIDDVYYTGAEKLSSSMMDISGIEILRGPQGTLFGRNTIAGAILVHTTDPQFEWGFGAEINLDEDSRQEGIFTANVPIWGEQVAARAAYRWGRAEGIIHDRLVGHGQRQKMQALRAKLRIQPFDNLDIIFSYSDQKARAEGLQAQYFNITDTYMPLLQVFDPEVEGNLDDYEHSSDTPDGGTELQTDYVLKATLTALDHDFMFIGNISDQEGVGGLDIDYGPAPLLRGWGDRFIDQYSLEFRAVSDFGGWFEYVAGAYHFHGTRLHNTNITLLPVIGTSELTDAILPDLVGGLIGDLLPAIGPFQTENFYTIFDQITDSYAFYGQATLAFIDDLKFVVGARYSIDKKSVDFKGTATGPAGAPTGAPLLNYSLGVEDFHLIDERRDTSFDPKLSAIWSVTEDINIYGTVATGYKNGGFNAQAWTSTAKLSFEPETSISYELGMKGEFFQGASRLNIALFHSDFDDLQASVWDGTTFIVDNAANVITQGVEIEGQLMLPFGLFMTAGLSWVDATYQDFKEGPCVAGSEEDFCDVSGNRLPVPEFQAMTSINYVNPMGNLPLDAFLGLDVNWQSDVQFAADGDPLDSEDAYTLVNARVGLMGDDQTWSFMLYMRNVFDKTVKESSADVILLTGTHFAGVNDPRTISAHFNVHF